MSFFIKVNFKNKLSFASLLLSTFLSLSNLQAMEVGQDLCENPTAILRKADSMLSEGQDFKNQTPIKVTINPRSKFFTLKGIVQKAIVLMIVKNAENWLDIAKLSLEHIRQFRGSVDFIRFEQDIYEAIISLLAPRFYSNEYCQGKVFNFSQLTVDVDELFEESKDTDAQCALEKAFQNHFLNEKLRYLSGLWNALSLVEKEESDLQQTGEGTKNIGTSVNFRDRFREGLGKNKVLFTVSLSDLKENSILLDMFGALSLSADSPIDDDFLGEVLKHKNIQDLNLGSRPIKSIALIEQAVQVEHLVIGCTSITDISSIAKMSRLRTLNLSACKHIMNAEVLLEAPSLEQVILATEIDISRLKEKFEVVEENRSFVVLKRKKSSENKSEN